MLRGQLVPREKLVALSGVHHAFPAGLLITEFIKEDSPFYHPCHYQDYDRSMLYPGNAW